MELNCIFAMPSSQQQSTVESLLEAMPPTPGHKVAAQRGGFVHAVFEPGSVTFKSFGDFAEVLLKPVPRMRSRIGSGQFIECDAPAGTLLLTPADMESAGEWDVQRESIAVGYLPGELKRLAGMEFNVANLELRPPAVGHVDERALRLVTEMRLEASRGAILSEVYIDGLMLLFGLNLLRNYSNVADLIKFDKPDRLGAVAAKRIDEFLRENYGRKLTTAEMAGIVGLSPSHFLRAFRNTFNRPPHQYVVGLRIKQAVTLLRTTDLSIAEVAYLSGFSSQSHLTATLRQRLNLTPGDIRRGSSYISATSII
ncbi:helix-turn-helix domain-containing protein [Nitratireductor sp. GCM10026969]|uniref:helix-turn-helix domain-containing protein n=1 Tax=Nitratireductor sp. GCM10026969 TaxID=3252645 RepID=UPI00360CD1FB